MPIKNYATCKICGTEREIETGTGRSCCNMIYLEMITVTNQLNPLVTPYPSIKKGDYFCSKECLVKFFEDELNI